jgi:hypothetical protein
MPKTFSITTDPGLQDLINEYLNDNKLTNNLKLIRVDTENDYAVYTFKKNKIGNWQSRLFHLAQYIINNTL